MENNENNNLNELDQLKAQYETLKEQFDQQEIVNDRLMKSSIKSNVDFYMRYRWKQYILYPLGILVALLAIKWEFNGNLSLMLFYITFMLVSFAFEILMLRKLHVKTIENKDLLTLSNQARGFKKLYSTFWILGAVPMLILFVGLFSKARYDTHLPNLGYFIFKFYVALVIFVSVGIVDIRHKTKPCDEIIRQIEALGTTENRKTGFDKKQKWFYAAMIVVFLGLDVWAYTIVGSYLKLPPMYRTVTYKRPDTTILVEEQLSVWEVYADTVVAPNEVSAVTEKWQQNESIVVMKGFGDDEAQVQLYALKMNSPEGPIVSSARIGGTPVVEEVVTRESVFNKDKVEEIPVIIRLTPEAGQLWHDYFQTGEEIKSLDIALVVDGMVYHKTNFTSLHGVTNKSFSIGWIWRKDKLDDFCERLIRQ